MKKGYILLSASNIYVYVYEYFLFIYFSLYKQAYNIIHFPCYSSSLCNLALYWKESSVYNQKRKKKITNNERKKKSDLHIDYTLVEAHNTVAPADTSSISRIDNDDSCLGKRPLCF